MRSFKFGIVACVLFAALLLQPATGVARTADWGMFAGDAQHSGLSPYVGQTGALQKWSVALRPAGGPTEFSSPVVASDGTVVVQTFGTLTAVKNGQVLWQHTNDGVNFFNGDPLVVGRTVIVHTFSYPQGGQVRGLSAFDLKTGESVWANPVVDPIGALGKAGSLFASRGGTIYSVGYGLAAFSSRGTLLWFSSASRYSAALSNDGTYLWTYDESGSNLLKVSALTGALIGPAIPLPAPHQGYQYLSIGLDGTVYAPSWDSTGAFVTAVRPDGTRWDVGVPGGLDNGVTIGMDGTLFVPFMPQSNPLLTGGVVCLSPVDGHTVWQSVLGGSNTWTAGGIVADAANRIYVSDGSTPGNLVCLDGSSGNPLWQFGLPRDNWFSSVAIGSDGTVYYCDSYGVLYAIGN